MAVNRRRNEKLRRTERVLAVVNRRRRNDQQLRTEQVLAVVNRRRNSDPENLNVGVPTIPH